MGYTNLVHFFDDGISSVAMKCPGFQELIREIDNGNVAAILVKVIKQN